MGYKLNNGGVPLDMIAALIKGHNFTTFVETGTSSGQSILVAAQSGLFKELHTVELNEGTVRQDIIDIMPSNVQLNVGDSVKFLKSLQIKAPTVYWLDAHYSGSEPAPKGVDECPLLDEMYAIFDNNSPEDILIVIDDARLFLGAPPKPHNPEHWPNLIQIIDTIDGLCKFSISKCHMITLVDDYIVSFPDHLFGNFNKFWQETYSLRYP